MPWWHSKIILPVYGLRDTEPGASFEYDSVVKDCGIGF